MALWRKYFNYFFRVGLDAVLLSFTLLCCRTSALDTSIALCAILLVVMDTQDTLTPAMREALAAAGRLGGKRRTQAQADAHRAVLAAVNARRVLTPLADLSCDCAAGQSLPLDQPSGHRAACPRGRAIKRRGLLPAP